MPTGQQGFGKLNEAFKGSLKEPNTALPPQDSRAISQAVLTDVQKIKLLRQDSDAIIQRVKDLPPSRETSLTITKLQEGVMWLGMELKRRNETNPYPSSKDPSTGDVIESTADGLKF